MNMVGHDYPGMQSVTAAATLLNLIDHALRNARRLQMHRTGAIVVEQPVHIYKCLSRTHRAFGKLPSGREAAVESKCDKQRLAHHIEVRQMALGHGHRLYGVSHGGKISARFELLVG